MNTVYANRYRIEKQFDKDLLNHYCILPCHDLKLYFKWKKLSIVLFEVDRNQEDTIKKKYENKNHTFTIIDYGRIVNTSKHSVLLWYVHDGRMEESYGKLNDIVLK